MKILQIINSYAPEDGGAQNLALEFHRAYLAQGIDSHLLSLMPSPAGCAPHTTALNFRNPYSIALFFRLCAFLRQPGWRDADVIHVHLFPAQFWVALAVRLLGMKTCLITTEHNTFNRRRRYALGRLFDRLYYRHYAQIACISAATHENMAQWLPEMRDKLVTIYNGIKMPIASQNASHSMHDSQCDKRIVLSMGRLSEQKNYATAIRAIAQVRRSNFEYWIAGKEESPKLAAELQDLVKSLQLEHNVKFLGFRSDIKALLSQADIFLLTSLWEGFGLAVAEAMAAGLPVVVSDVPGVREVVGSDSRCGFLIDPAAPHAFATALETLLDGAILRENMGRNARLRAQSFSLEVTIANYLALYRAQLSEARKKFHITSV